MRLIHALIPLALLCQCRNDSTGGRLDDHANSYYVGHLRPDARGLKPPGMPDNASDSVAQPLGKLPLGSWRLADPGELDHVVLWLSHILIRHDEATKANEVPFNHGDWMFTQDPPRRSRAEAVDEVAAIAERARRDPDLFADLARQYSEDPVTKANGGSLGGMTALMFAPWPQFLDLFAETEVGGVTRVIESAHGFHIFRRNPTPLEQRVSGERIVIAHDEAPLIREAARGEVPRRTRAEAMTLAVQISTEARQFPERFPQLVARYSDHHSAAANGDLGSWSTHEVSSIHRELEALASLDVGEVSHPVDTVFGLQILRRTPERPRAEWAMRRLEVRFDPTQPPTAPDSQAKALARAKRERAALAAAPQNHEGLAKQYCCSNVLRVKEGRFSPIVEPVLARLRHGQVAEEPLLYGPGVYLVVLRVDSSELPAVPPTRFELPNPTEPDIAYFLRARSGTFIDKGVRSLGELAKASLGLASEDAEALFRLHEQTRFSRIAANERLEHLLQLRLGASRLLSRAQFAEYERLTRRHFEELMYNSGIWSFGEE